MQHFKKSVYDLIVETSTNLPADVRRAVQAAKEREDKVPDRLCRYPRLLITFIWQNATYLRYARIRACLRLLYTVPSGQTKSL
jgi:hypothetical protein